MPDVSDAMDAAFRDRAVYLPAPGTLVLADLHVGRDEASEVEFPLGERGDLRERLAALLDRFAPTEAVFAGDVLHEFATVSRRSRETVRDLASACRDVGARPVMVAGNHDAMLGEVWRGTVHDEYRVGSGRGADDGDGGEDDEDGGEDGDDGSEEDDGGSEDGDDGPLVCHGHEAPTGEASCYVVGHDHPVIEIEGQRRPCYLYGEGVYRGGDVLVLPAFSRLAAGATVNGMGAGAFQSPLVTDADAFRPVVRDEAADETLAFPQLGEFRRML